jgi:hypothetical protein
MRRLQSCFIYTEVNATCLWTSSAELLLQCIETNEMSISALWISWKQNSYQPSWPSQAGKCVSMIILLSFSFGVNVCFQTGKPRYSAVYTSILRTSQCTCGCRYVRNVCISLFRPFKREEEDVSWLRLGTTDRLWLYTWPLQPRGAQSRRFVIQGPLPCQCKSAPSDNGKFGWRHWRLLLADSD